MSINISDVKAGDFLSYHDTYFDAHTFSVLLYPNKKYEIIKVEKEGRTKTILFNSEYGKRTIRYHTSLDNFTFFSLKEMRLEKLQKIFDNTTYDNGNV